MAATRPSATAAHASRGADGPDHSSERHRGKMVPAPPSQWPNGNARSARRGQGPGSCASFLRSRRLQSDDQFAEVASGGGPYTMLDVPSSLSPPCALDLGPRPARVAGLRRQVSRRVMTASPRRNRACRLRASAAASRGFRFASRERARRGSRRCASPRPAPSSGRGADS